LANTSSTTRSARRIGNVTLGGLFPVHEYGSPQEPCGAISEFRGIQRLEAMLFAIEQINNDKTLLPGVELGALILDTCSDDNYALERSLQFVLSRLTSSSCKCVNASISESRQNDNIFGVVGATLSSVSVHVANLLRLFQLPQISYASTTPKLSEPSFDYFARTVPSDSNQARAIVDILQRLNFTYVNAIYSYGDYGEGGFREFRRLLKISSTTDDDLNIIKKKQTRICIADEQRLHRDATIQDIKGILQTMLDRIKSGVQVRVYVLFVTKEDARKLLQAIKLFNGTQRPVLIASDAWGKESSVVINGETDELAVGALTLELISNQPANFDRYFNALRPDIPNEKLYTNSPNKNLKPIVSRNPWFNEFWELRFSCNLTNSSCLNHQLNETNWDSKLQFIVDAVYVFAHALHEYLNCSSTACLNTLLTDINGKKLFQLILGKIFLSEFRRKIYI
jgi:metabotropic glutamate receptor 2/3